MTSSMHKITEAGCQVRRVDCGTGPTNLWEFIDAEGDNPSGQTFPTRKTAVEYGLWRIEQGLDGPAQPGKAPLGLCTLDPAHGPAEVPWSGERLCWPCADTALDLLAKACERELPVTVGRGVTTPGFVYEFTWPASCTGPDGRVTASAIFEEAARSKALGDCLTEDIAMAFLAAAGGDPELAAELARDCEYLRGA